MGLFDFMQSKKRSHKVVVYADYVKRVLVEASNDEEALEWVTAAIDAGIIPLEKESDFVLEVSDFEDITDEESMSIEDKIEATKKLIEDSQGLFDADQELRDEIENRDDLSGKWVVAISLPLTKEVSVKADTNEEAERLAKELSESNQLRFSFADASNSDDQESLEWDVMRLEYALESGITEEECFPLSTRVQVAEDSDWVYYIGRESIFFDENKLGHWPFSFSNRAEAEKACFGCVDILCAPEARHENRDSGVAGFYSNYDDEDTMRYIILFMLAGNMLPLTTSGSLENIQFVFEKPRADISISLSDYIDLNTSKFLKPFDGA